MLVSGLDNLTGRGKPGVQRRGRLGKLSRQIKLGEPEGEALPNAYVALSFFA